MPPSPKDITTITFDSFSTLVFEIKALTEALRPYTDDPGEVAGMWRQRAVLYTLLANFLNEYDTYFRMHRLGLEYAVDYHGLDLSDAELDELNETFYHLPPFDDVGVLEDLDEAGYDLYIISNGNPAMLDGLVENTGVGPYLDGTVSADEIKQFKPAAELYKHALSRADARPDEMMHVTAGLFDAQGAQNVGMHGCWLNRKTVPFLSQKDPFGERPDWIIESLHDVFDRFC
jgi:2-haloacid dehalogenase